jgi:carbamoyl-phosphate synthase small subunit
MEAALALEDGRVFRGRSFGAPGSCTGEVVFNTSMTGYQEVLTDPSYRGQIVAMTYPLIGNCGVNDEDVESSRPQVEGFCVREFSQAHSNWRSRKDLPQYLRENRIPAISELDTRALTRHIRTRGAMRGALVTGAGTVDEAGRQAREAPRLRDLDLVGQVTCEQECGCEVTVVPAWFPATDVLEKQPDGVFLSNGPGDPEAAGDAVGEIRSLMGRVPLFGICLGHQIMGLALGGSTFKLKFGHRGGNHPVKELRTGHITITSQNHGYAVEPASLPTEVEATHVNLNDGTCEGFRHRGDRFFAVQYHPESSPGPHDADHLFRRFLEVMDGGSSASSPGAPGADELSRRISDSKGRRKTGERS